MHRSKHKKFPALDHGLVHDANIMREQHEPNDRQSVLRAHSARIRIHPHPTSADGGPSEYVELEGEVTIRRSCSFVENAPADPEAQKKDAQTASEYTPPRVTPAFYAKARTLIDTIARRYTPPLQPLDVLGLSVEALAKQFFHAYLPEGKLTAIQLLGPVQSALLTVLRVHPMLAREAGVCPDLGDSAVPREFKAALRTFYRWGNTVLNPLVREFGTSTRKRRMDPKRREDLVVILWGAILKSSVMRGDQKGAEYGMLSALGGTIGERADGRESLCDGAFREWFKLLSGDAQNPMPILRRRGDRLTLNTEAAREIATQKLGVGKRKPERLQASLDHPAAEGWMAQSQATPLPREPSSEDWIAYRELRDLRDALDGHRLMQEAVEKAYDCGAHGASDHFDGLANAAAALNRIQEPALQAAVAYTWSRGGRARAHGGWTTDQVASEYDVTIRQIEGRLEQAREMLGYTRRPA